MRIRVEAVGLNPVDAVVDTLGAESATANLGLLVHGGGIACVAGRADLGVVEPFTIAPSVREIALGAAHSHGELVARRHLATDLAELPSLVDAGRLDPMVGRVLRLDEAGAGPASLAGRHVSGRLVVAL